jgi:hypothetical protein
MKKSFYLLLLGFLMISFVQAQIKKDQWLLGGQISFGGSTTESAGDEVKNNGQYYQLSAGKALRDNRVLGGNLSYAGSRQAYFNGVEQEKLSLHDYGIGVFYRMYKTLGKDFFFFGQGNADFNRFNSKTESPTSINNKTTNGWGVRIALTPGIAYAVTPKFHLELTLPGLFGLGLNYDRTEYANNQTPDSITRDFNGFTSLTTQTPAGYLGVGFRLIL